VGAAAAAAECGADGIASTPATVTGCLRSERVTACVTLRATSRAAPAHVRQFASQGGATACRPQSYSRAGAATALAGARSLMRWVQYWGARAGWQHNARGTATGHRYRSPLLACWHVTTHVQLHAYQAPI
jgi:hypothetical protein